MAADPAKTDPPEPTEDEKAESHFWDEHEKRTRGILDAWFEEKLKAAKGTGTARNTGRVTLPRVLADIFFPEVK